MTEPQKATKLVVKPLIEITNTDLKQFVWLFFLSMALGLMAWRQEILTDRISDLTVQVKCEGVSDANNDHSAD